MDPHEIQKIFGAPMNTSGTPNQSFHLKFWHVLFAGVVGFLVYKGVEKIFEERLEKEK